MAVNLGLTPNEFWDLTFFELWAVFDAKNPKYADRMTLDEALALRERIPD